MIIMNRKKIIICIIAAVMILSAFPTLMAETDEKVYTGPKEVYERGKPSSPPGQNKPKPPKEEDDPPDSSVDKWAVVIGISNYRGRQYDLLYCDDDAQDMYSYLISRGYPTGNIRLLLDGDAKANKIMAAVDWLNSWEGADSEVVFFYSGHGSWYDGYDDGDIEYRDEGIVSADLYLILDGQLRQKFSTFESSKISFTFDSCFSGGMNDLETSGRIIATACNETEYSYETADLQNGVFTYFYMDGLELHDTVEEAFDYASPLATEFMAMYGEDMSPQLYDMYLDNWEFI